MLIKELKKKGCYDEEAEIKTKREAYEQKKREEARNRDIKRFDGSLKSHQEELKKLGIIVADLSPRIKADMIAMMSRKNSDRKKDDTEN